MKIPFIIAITMFIILYLVFALFTGNILAYKWNGTNKGFFILLYLVITLLAFVVHSLEED